MLAVPAGDPGGIGYDLVCFLQEKKLPADLVVIAGIDALRERARLLKVPFSLPAHGDGDGYAVSVLDMPLAAPASPGQPDGKNARQVLAAIDKGAQMSLAKEVDGMVTAPVSKSLLAGVAPGFSGQTEHLAKLAGVRLPVMAMVSPNLRVALATTHLPLADVPGKITAELVLETLQVADGDAKRRFGIARPHWKVCGLNPHAGEQGLLGDEEEKSIVPGIDRARAKGIDASGPHPADTAFLPQNVGPDDFFLAMYHDQVLPMVKRDDFANSVNVTLGLPFIRTSVDHGTAYDIAGTGKADVGPMLAAIDLAATLAKRERAQ